MLLHIREYILMRQVNVKISWFTAVRASFDGNK